MTKNLVTKANFKCESLLPSVMSAVIPPKRSRPLTPAMKLAAGDGGSPIPTGSSSARPPPPALRLSSPSVLCPAVTALQRPTLKLASLSLPGSFASLSLAIPAGSDAADVRSDVDSDDEDAPRWREGDQKRMAGELLKVIRGGDGLEDDLSGRHRILVRRSPSRENPESVGGTSMSRSTSTDDTHLVLPVEHSPDQPVAEDDVLDEELEVNPGNLRDLGKLGEGASGEVRKVQHTPSGMIMAKKVRHSSLLLGDALIPSLTRRFQPLRTPPSTSSTSASWRSCASARIRSSCSTTAHFLKT